MSYFICRLPGRRNKDQETKMSNLYLSVVLFLPGFLSQELISFVGSDHSPTACDDGIQKITCAQVRHLLKTSILL
jgi:hypothetical protein